MILKSYILGWPFTFLLCFKLLHGVWGDCGPPPVIPNTNPVAETFGTQGQTIVYTCDRSTGYYEIPVKSTTITCQTDDTWTSIEEFCTRACGVPERLAFAAPTPGALDENIFLPNATVSYECRPGYTRIRGIKALITCLEDFTWSTPEIFCQRRTCGNPGEVENGNMEATDFLFGSTVYYTCNEGFRSANKRNFRDCLADGTWSNILPQCDAVICAAPDLPVNGEYNPQKDEYTYLDSVTFSCKKPLVVAGNASIACTTTGEWSSGSPICKEVKCANPDNPRNSERTSGFAGPYTLNSAISFKCNDNLVLKGSSSIMCNIDSQWVPEFPKCERVSCGDPGIIPNGIFSAPNFFYGSKAIYTCNKGYGLISLVDYRICQINGNWSDSVPNCAALCGEPPKLTFAVFKESRPFYFNGTFVHYECVRGFIEHSDKENKLTCRGHSWSVPDDFCIRISCGDPGKINNGHVQVEDHLFGSRARYTCEEGYVMNTTQNYRECQADGTWSNAISCTEHIPYVLGTGAIVGIVIGIVAVLAFAIFFLCRYFSKKQKRGKLQPDTVQYSHCNA
ncbi:complement decay-accelerating factor isoform 2-T2 [Mantella aurantiaca]